MNIHRRAFITGLVGLIAAPAIVRASSLMPVRSLRLDPGLETLNHWVNRNGVWVVDRQIVIRRIRPDEFALP